jgi:hypothetical protein
VKSRSINKGGLAWRQVMRNQTPSLLDCALHFCKCRLTNKAENLSIVTRNSRHMCVMQIRAVLIRIMRAASKASSSKVALCITRPRNPQLALQLDPSGLDILESNDATSNRQRSDRQSETTRGSCVSFGQQRTNGRILSKFIRRGKRSIDGKP